jgi:hypothetical protein
MTSFRIFWRFAHPAKSNRVAFAHGIEATAAVAA